MNSSLDKYFLSCYIVIVMTERNIPLPTDFTAPIPSGRFTIIGKVINIKKNFRWGGENMIVQMENGWKIFGHVPRNLMNNEDFKNGCIVKFVATIKPSNNDFVFGFFSRPTNAKILVK